MIENAHIIGFPSLYGGAGAELYHQIPVWEKLGVKLHFIPTQKNVKGAALYHEMLERGHVIHEAYDWNAIPENASVISFCNEDFLAALPEIRQRTRHTVFVNCMTWLFGKEKEAMSRGDIALFLYSPQGGAPGVNVGVGVNITMGGGWRGNVNVNVGRSGGNGYVAGGVSVIKFGSRVLESKKITLNIFFVSEKQIHFPFPHFREEV